MYIYIYIYTYYIHSFIMKSPQHPSVQSGGCPGSRYHPGRFRRGRRHGLLRLSLSYLVAIIPFGYLTLPWKITIFKR